MTTLAERSLRVAMLGYVPTDDPTIIADMQQTIERLTGALEQIRTVCDDNAPAVCDKGMALAFVRSVADGNLRCPHPANSAPDGTTVEQCIAAGDCGCVHAKARP